MRIQTELCYGLGRYATRLRSARAGLLTVQVFWGHPQTQPNANCTTLPLPTTALLALLVPADRGHLGLSPAGCGWFLLRVHVFEEPAAWSQTGRPEAGATDQEARGDLPEQRYQRFRIWGSSHKYSLTPI